MNIQLMQRGVGLGLVLLMAGCGTLRPTAPETPAKKDPNQPSKLDAMKLDTPVPAGYMPMAPEANSVRQDLYRAAHGVRAMRNRINTLSDLLATPEGAAEAAAQLRGQREALLATAAGLRDAKVRLDQMMAALPEQDAGVIRLQAEVKSLEAKLLADRQAADHELKQLRETLAAERAQLQTRIDQLTREQAQPPPPATPAPDVAAMNKKLELARLRILMEIEKSTKLEQQVRAAQTDLDSDIGKLKRQLEAAQKQGQRDRAIAAEREKQIQELRSALAARTRAAEEAKPIAVMAEPPTVAPAQIVAPAPAPAPAPTLAPAPAPVPDMAAKPPAEVVSAPVPTAAPEPEPTAPALELTTPAPEPAAATILLGGEPTGKPDPTPVQQVAAANVALQQGNLARAMALFRAALARDDSLVGARIGLAACAFSMDDMTEARRRIDEVLAGDPRNAQALGLRGIVNWRQGRLQEAEEDSARAVAGSPGDAQLLNYRGIILHAMGRTTEAISAVQSAVELDAGNADAMLNLAILLAMSKPPDVAGALSWYERALAAGAARDEGLDRLQKKQGGTP